MLKVLSAAAAVSALAASISFADAIPSRTVYGNYIEARTADVYTGPCFANAEVGLTGDLAVMGWKIDQGSFQGVNLDGLSVMGAIHASNTLGNVIDTVYPVKAVLIIDERANAEQRLALKAFAQKMGGQLLADVVHIEYQPIEFAVADNNVHTRKAVMTAGNMVKLETRAMTDADQVCHNESVWYQPLTPVEHAMAAYTVSNDFGGTGLGTVWKYSGNRGSFVGTFQVSE